MKTVAYVICMLAVLSVPVLAGGLPPEAAPAISMPSCDDQQIVLTPDMTAMAADQLISTAPFAATSSGSVSALGATSGRKDWVSVAATAVTVVGAAAGLSQALLRNGSKATGPGGIPVLEMKDAGNGQPVPEPSSLILASLAVSAAVIHLRKRLIA